MKLNYFKVLLIITAALLYFLTQYSCYAQGRNVDSLVQKKFPESKKIEAEHPCKNYQPNKTFHINEIIIRDTFLLNQIKLFIREMEQVDSLFISGLGYFKLHIHSTGIDSHPEVTHSFYIKPIIYSPKKGNDAFYPHAFAKINNRLVFINYEMYNDLFCFSYSKESKQKIREITEPYLPPKKRITLPDEQGNHKVVNNFRLDYPYLHGGKYIYYFIDKAPEVYLDMSCPVKSLKPEWQKPGIIKQEY